MRFSWILASARRNATAFLVLTAGSRNPAIPLGAECYLYTGLLGPLILGLNTKGTFGQAVVPIPPTAPVGALLTASSW